MVRGVGVVGTGVVFAEHAAALAMLGDRLRLVGIAEVDVHRRRAATEACFVPYATNDHRELVERAGRRRRRRRHAAVAARGRSSPTPWPPASTSSARSRSRPTSTAIDRIIDARPAAPGSAVDGVPVAVPTGGAAHGPPPRPRAAGTVACSVGSSASPASRAVTTSAGWWGRWDRAGGGAVMTQAIHEVDLMLHLFGAVTSVRAEMATLGLAIESEDTAIGDRPLRRAGRWRSSPRASPPTTPPPRST